MSVLKNVWLPQPGEFIEKQAEIKELSILIARGFSETDKDPLAAPNEEVKSCL
jgi:hypothetical protein